MWLIQHRGCNCTAQNNNDRYSWVAACKQASGQKWESNNQLCLAVNCMSIADYMNNWQFSGRSRRYFVGSTEPPLRFYVLSCQIKYSNRAVRLRLSNRTVTPRYSISFILGFHKKNIVWERNESMDWEREKRECKNWRPVFGLNFWLSLTSTLQQSRIPPLKILDPPLQLGER